MKNKSYWAKERTHHRFTDHYKDDEGGLYYMKARYYDPKLGRFITPDPLFLESPEKCIESSVECNLYLYAGNNPIINKDSNGFWYQYAVGAGVGAGLDLVAQLYIDNKSIDKINWASVGLSAAGGALGVGLASKAEVLISAGMRATANIVGDAGIGAISTVAQNAITGERNSVSRSAWLGSLGASVPALAKGMSGVASDVIKNLKPSGHLNNISLGQKLFCVGGSIERASSGEGGFIQGIFNTAGAVIGDSSVLDRVMPDSTKKQGK